MDNHDSTMKIILGGKEFTVPLLVAKENRIIDPLILRLLPLFSTWQSDRTSALAHIGEYEYTALQDIAFVAIRREQPGITKDIFLDMPVTLFELISAFSIIAQQTGIFQKTSEDSDGNMGEVQGSAAPL